MTGAPGVGAAPVGHLPPHVVGEGWWRGSAPGACSYAADIRGCGLWGLSQART